MKKHNMKCSKCGKYLIMSNSHCIRIHGERCYYFCNTNCLTDWVLKRYTLWFEIIPRLENLSNRIRKDVI